jgi:hypothetical protein
MPTSKARSRTLLAPPSLPSVRPRALIFSLRVGQLVALREINESVSAFLEIANLLRMKAINPCNFRITRRV